MPNKSQKSGYYRVSVTPQRLVRLELKTIWTGARCRKFLRGVRGRPRDKSWLVDYGREARNKDIPFAQALEIIRAHIKKYCGNRNRQWIENGLREGYEEEGLRS